MTIDMNVIKLDLVLDRLFHIIVAGRDQGKYALYFISAFLYFKGHVKNS